MVPNLRSHQAELFRVTEAIRNGSDVRRIVVAVAPGGGKSVLPPIAAIQLIPSHAQKICWVVPRLTLARQAADEFCAGKSRTMFGHQLEIRQAVNEEDPSRGTNGYVVTYDAIAERPELHEREHERVPYILVLDECHHVVVGSPTHKAILGLVQRAKILILMSGTLERNIVTEKIAFLRYKPLTDITSELDLDSSEKVAVIRYTLRQALAERAVLPLRFHFQDGSAEFEDSKGNHVVVPSLARTGKEARAAIYTALATGHAETLLDKCVADWRMHRQRNPRAKLLVVATQISHAKKILERLNRMGVIGTIATSEDSESAQKAIGMFRTSSHMNALVTVMMAYEGMDVPSITHVACLTRIRSKPWLDQMMSRANRVDFGAGPYESQSAIIYAPDDPLIRGVVRSIEDEQLASVKEKSDKEPKEQDAAGGGRGQIIALASKLTKERIQSFVAQNTVPAVPTDQIIASLVARSASAPLPIPRLSPTQREYSLREEITRYTRKADRKAKEPPGTLNKVIIREFDKPRAEMTEAELKRVLVWLEKNHPLK